MTAFAALMQLAMITQAGFSYARILSRSTNTLQLPLPHEPWDGQTDKTPEQWFIPSAMDMARCNEEINQE